MTIRRRRIAATVAMAWSLIIAQPDAHSGPPYPIVSDRTVGPYRISVWTDPDATDDGSRGGQFWIIVDAAAGTGAIPSDTRVSVTISPRDRPGASMEESAAPVSDSATRQFAALLMDHEGAFGVRVSVRGPMGEAAVDADVQATYDLRPPPLTLALYLMPFLLVGGLWLKLLLRRRADGRRAPSSQPQGDR